MPRAPYPPPRHVDDAAPVTATPKKITFLHPGYRHDAQPLLILPACDKNDTIDHEIARMACAGVACNQFEGFFTTDQEGHNRVEGPQLPYNEDGYFFQVPVQNELRPYSVCPSFRHYMPPKLSQLPALWKQCTISNTPSQGTGRSTSTIAHNVIKRDGSCRVTNYIEQTEAAHVIPAGESEWFHSRGMHARVKIDHSSNHILLRSDVHKLFDQRHFAVLPRRMEDSHKTVELVAYVLKRDPLHEVIQLYHDVRLQPLLGVDILFLFCRFAWTIFETLDTFLDQGNRWLTIRNVLTGDDEKGKYNGDRCRDRAFTHRARSQSPKKQKRAASNEAEEKEKAGWSRVPSLSGKSDCGQSDVSAHDSFNEEEEQRGRKRSRSWSSDEWGTNSANSFPWSSATCDTDTRLGQVRRSTESVVECEYSPTAYGTQSRDVRTVSDSTRANKDFDSVCVHQASPGVKRKRLQPS